MPPDCTDVQTLEFEWEPFESAWIFRNPASFEEISAWYETHLPEEVDVNPEPGRLEIYFEDEKGIEWSVLIADTQDDSAALDLDAYIGSTRLKSLIDNTTSGVIGALFKHKAKEK